YRTTSQRKSNVAANTVTSETIEGRPNASFIQTLQGQVPGLNISTGSGQPGGSNTTVILRGIGSINGNIEPLYVIDGVPMSSANFRSINPNDIENVSILKDSGATSIYGNRGANGVIVVTTKKAGFGQDLQIKYVGTVGVSSLQNNKYNFMGGAELMRFENQTELNSQRWSQREIDNAFETDWLDVIFREAFSQSHTLSFSSGSKNMSQFTSVGYTEQEGILRNTDLKRFNFRNNLSGKNNNGRLTYNTNINVNYSKSNMATSLGTGGINQNFVIGALIGVPYFRPEQYNPDDAWGSIIGVYGGHPNNENLVKLSPLLILDKLDKFTNYQDELKAVATAGLDYDLGAGLSIGTNLGVDYTDILQTRHDSPYSFNEQLFAQEGQEYLGFESELRNRIVSFNTTTNLKWNKVFNEKHE